MAMQRTKKRVLAGDEVGRSVISNECRENAYPADYKHKTPSGNPSRTNRDAVARALTGLTRDELKLVAAENALTERVKSWSCYSGTNTEGIFRMTLGNTLRAHIRRGGAVVVQKKVIRTL